MRGALKEELTNRFPWLFDELGFRIAEHDFSYKHMGSSFAALQSDTVRLKFTNDRGAIGVDVASSSEPERWFELGFLWRSLTGERPSPELDGWAWFLRDHLAQISEALGRDFEKTKAAFDQREREGKEASAAYISSLHQYAPRRRIAAFVRGPLGWIAAALLLIWLIIRP